jgi:hypothetical protein
LKAFSDLRVTALTASGGAIALAVMSAVLGYGWPATAVSTLIGIGAGYWASRRMLVRERLPANASLSDLSRWHGKRRSDPRGATRGILASRKLRPGALESESSAYAFPIDPFRSLPKYQRWAAATFLLQAAVGVVAIAAFWIAQSAGLDVQIPHASSIDGFFPGAFPINANGAVSRARFDNLFVPLSCIYLLSLTVFAAAIAHSLGSLLREFRKHTLILLGTAFFFVFLTSFFFQSVDYFGVGSLKRHIIDGHLWGYFVFFCIIPFLGIFLAAELPEEIAGR